MNKKPMYSMDSISPVTTCRSCEVGDTTDSIEEAFAAQKVVVARLNRSEVEGIHHDGFRVYVTACNCDFWDGKHTVHYSLQVLLDR